MRRSRRGGRSGMMEFGGSGEDSFVAVVVTKLTGALLFILLLTMVIMALIPRGAETLTSASAETRDREPLRITTPDRLPEAIAGHPYQLALAASGGSGPLRWSLDGPLPPGMEFDAESGQLRGQPQSGASQPAVLVARVSDGARATSRTLALAVLQPDQPLRMPDSWKPAIPPLPWREWLRHGFGFLLLFLTYLVGMNALAGLQRWASARRRIADDPTARDRAQRRFARYRWTVRFAALGMMAGLAAWLWRAP